MKDNSLILSRSISEILEVFNTTVPQEFRKRCNFIKDMTKKDIIDKILELKLTPQTEDVKLQIQKLQQELSRD